MSAIRVTKFYLGDEGIQLEASEGSNLYKLLCPSAVTEKSLWERVLSTFRSQEEKAHLTLAWRYANGWEEAIRWPIFMEARKWAKSSTGFTFDTPDAKERHAAELLTDLIKTEGGKEIFANYIESIANAIATSQYAEADPELQSKLRVAFWDDIARPTFDKLRANKAAQDKLEQETKSKEVTQANEAASSYLAARN